MSEQGDARYVVATDVGGTCTDAVLFAAGEPVRLGKALSTPPDFADGVLARGRRRGGGRRPSPRTRCLRGPRSSCTARRSWDNTLLTRSGARTGLITTEGFEDTLVITPRRPTAAGPGLPRTASSTRSRPTASRPWCPRACTRGVPERVDYKGAVLRALDEDAVRRAVRSLVDDDKVEALAVSFLWSFYNDSHERRVGDLIRETAPGVYVTLSSDIAPVPGEYERASTTVINAYAGRMARDYIISLQALLRGQGYDGPLPRHAGLWRAAPGRRSRRARGGACSNAARPQASSAAVTSARSWKTRDIIACDMGGTTFKVGVIQGGAIDYAREPMVDRYHYVAPKIEVVSIGAGGGSIVALDPATGVPGVGPGERPARGRGRSATARAATSPTLTDVMLLVGYMDPGTFPRRHDHPRCREGAAGVRREGRRAARHERGGRRHRHLPHRPRRRSPTSSTRSPSSAALDPRDFVLHAFGGSCGLLCGVFGAELGVRRIVIPYTASVNAAFGLLSADIVHEYSVTKTLPAPSPAGEINEIYAPMVARAREQLAAEGLRRRRHRPRLVHRPALRPPGARGDDAGRGRRAHGRRCRGPPRGGLRGALRAQVRQGLGLPRRRHGDDDVPSQRARPGGAPPCRDPPRSTASTRRRR